MGFSKGTLHYMKKNAEAAKPFSLNAHVRERLEMWGSGRSVVKIKKELDKVYRKPIKNNLYRK